MSNFTPGSGVRDVSVKDSGNDMLDGRNQLFAKRTLPGAKQAVEALDPAPGLFAPAAMADSGASRYELTETFSITDNVQCALQFSSIAANFTGFTGTNLLEAAENAQATFLTISTNGDPGMVAYSSNGKSRTALDSRAVIMNGESQVGVSLDGATDQSFLNLGQVLARFPDSVCVSVTSTGDSPRYYQLNEMNVSGDNCVGLQYNTPALGAAVYRVGAITYEDSPLIPDTGSGCVGIEVIKGTVAGYAAEVDVETAFSTGIDGDLIDDSILTVGDIVNKGKMNVTSRRHTGDIINEGFMTARIDEHVSGNIVNTGTLNGEIDGIRYGTWANGSGNEMVATFATQGGISGGGETLGRLTIDTTIDAIDSVIGFYFQTTGLNRVVQCDIINPDTADVYYTGSTSNSSFNPKVPINLAPTATPLPVNQVVTLEVIFTRTSGGFFGVQDPSAQINFTRTP